MGVRARVAALAGIFALGMSACGDVEPEEPEHRAFADAMCALYTRCCSAHGHPTDGATCRRFVDQVARGRTFDHAAGDTCLAELRARAERADFCSHDYAGPPCKRVFTSGPGERRSRRALHGRRGMRAVTGR